MLSIQHAIRPHRYLTPQHRSSCESYWDAVETVLASSELRVPDHRRDVVHVIDAFEARQWTLPVVFVCGLLEKEFPKYQTEDAILPDPIRMIMQSPGVQLRTSVQRQADERFLFDLGLIRANGGAGAQLSAVECEGRGEPAFFLSASRATVRGGSRRRCTPQPERERALEPMPFITTAGRPPRTPRASCEISPTHIESYLQCAYQFFAHRTLKLHGAPEQPWERLNALVQGSIVHRVLERSHRERRRVAEVFEDVFADYAPKPVCRMDIGRKRCVWSCSTISR